MTKNNRKNATMWKIKVADNWQGAMQTAAEKYMDVRQVLKFPKKQPRGVQKRHIIGYPVDWPSGA